MSERWPGGIITKTPVTPTGPSMTGSAPGVWTLEQAMYWQRQGLWPTQAITDPSFPYVSLLLSTTAINAAQNNTILDSSTNNFTFTNVDSPTQGSFSPYGSDWSGYFDGSGDYLTLPDNAALEPGSSNLTWEMWVNTTNLTQYATLYSRTPASFATGMWSLMMNMASFNTGDVGLYVADYSPSGPLLQTTGVNVRDGLWHHIAVVRNGSAWVLYVDGVSRATATWAGTIADLSTGPYIGIDQFYGRDYTGYISNLRVVKGTAVYTSAFTPPTTPLTAITNTSLLTCAYNRFRDGSTNNFTITRVGDSRTTDFSPFAPAAPYSTAANGGSLFFDGSNDATYIDSSNAALTLGTGDFTIELWVYQRTLSGAQSWVSTYGGPGSGYRFSPTNTLQFSWGDSDVLTSSTTTDINQWSHVAVTRSGSTVRIFKNGVVVATGTNSTNLTGGSTQTTLGRIPTYNQWYYNGWMSDVRIIKGTALYTANYTPPTAPLTAVSGTSVLASGTNAGIFDAASINDLSTIGNAQVSTTQAKFGTTSVAFDGTGDYLITRQTPQTQFGNGDFTWETWVYRSNSSDCAFYSDRGAGDYNGWMVGIRNNYVFLLASNNGSSWGIDTYASTAGSTVPTTTWAHIAVVRSGSTWAVYINGTQSYTRTLSGTLAQTAASVVIGSDLLGVSAFNGYMDDLRITKGVARYTANFTPPTTAFPTQ